jgi:3-phosphoshikimate 1-carboxyvinyltransferase
MNFKYQGPIGASKSILNRALVIQSYFKDLILSGDSRCDDVQDLKQCLSQIGKTDTFTIKEGGTTFRFFVLRISREIGKFQIKAFPRLMERPQDELLEVLHQVGVKAEKHSWGFSIESQGWQFSDKPLLVKRDRSSQFLSSLVLNSPKLKSPLRIVLNEGPSEDYFKMTLQVAKDLGAHFEIKENELIIHPWGSTGDKKYTVGADLSSTFSLACFAALNGDLEVTNVVKPELQPDSRFMQFFKAMNIPISLENSTLKISKSPSLRPLNLDLESCPDLFPVLSCLCAMAKGRSKLYGASQLKFKESDRLAKVFELFDHAKISYEKLPDGIWVDGLSQPHENTFDFDPDKDHRMAMAGAFLKFAGWKINIKDSKVVDKSFPEFWQITGVHP